MPFSFHKSVSADAPGPVIQFQSGTDRTISAGPSVVLLIDDACPVNNLGGAKRSIGLELVEGTVLGTDRSVVLSKRVFTSVHSLGTTFPFVTCPTGKYWTRVASGYLQMPLQSKVDVAQSR